MNNTIRFPIKMGVGGESGDECVLTDVVLASDYDRDIADLWRKLSSAMKRVARLENELRVIGYAEPQKWDADLRDHALRTACQELLDDMAEDAAQRHHTDKYRVFQISPEAVEKVRAALAAKEPSDE